jgi:hypothetical protein
MNEDRAMSGKVVPIRPRGAAVARATEDANTRPRLVPRVVSHAPGMSREAVYAGCAAQEQLIIKHEARLTALVAQLLVDGLPPIEDWVAAVLTTPGATGEQGAGAAGDVVEIAPREHAIEIARPWPSIRAALAEPSPTDRLDVMVEHSAAGGDLVGLVSFDPEPALPVTRTQAEAANLPGHLLFARGEAFASLHAEPADEASLLDAFLAHRRLVDEQADDLLEALGRRSVRAPLEELAGVLLALGPDGNAVSAVTREQARKLIEGKPLLARKLDRGAISGVTDDGRDILSVPVVVWAKGHVSVQTRELVEGK